MTTFEAAKAMGYAALVEKIREAGLKEYGLYPEPLMEKVFRANAKKTDIYVYAGLNNADTDRALLVLLKDCAESVLSGIEIAAMLTGAKASFLYLPEDETDLAEELKQAASAHHVILVNDIINVREAEEDLIIHIAAAADLAALVDGTYEEGAWIVTDGKAKKVPADTKAGDLVSLEGAKAVWLGYQYYTPEEAASLTAGDATNAVIRVIGNQECIVSDVQKRMLADRKASCGRCVFCREGLIQLEYMAREITQARGKGGFIDLTKEISEPMPYSTLCSVGQESSKAAMSAVEKFGSEFEAHIKKNVCPAGVCQAFVHIYIDPAACTGCGECIDVCPADCIEGKAKYIHMIDEFDCTRCGKCIDACEEEASIKTSGKLPKLPNRLTKVGKFKKH